MILSNNVRANYRNVAKGVEYAPVYLERFFSNLLIGDGWDLRNRYLHIHPSEEWSVQPNLIRKSCDEKVFNQMLEVITGTGT